MLSNNYHQQIIQMSQKNATIDDSRKYGVHFEYGDLFSRLSKLKKERVFKDSEALEKSGLRITSKPLIIDKIKSTPRISYRPKSPSSIRLTRLIPFRTEKNQNALNQSFKAASSEKTPRSSLSPHPKSLERTYRALSPAKFSKKFDNLTKTPRPRNQLILNI